MAWCSATVAPEQLGPHSPTAGVLAEKEAELETANGQLKRALESLQRLEETHKQVGGGKGPAWLGIAGISPSVAYPAGWEE
jgi:hypothetical protein